MLTADNRLRRKRDFEEVYRRGQRHSSLHFLVRYLRVRVLPTRVGVVASTKFSKRATIRNRHKRQVRAVLRDEISHLPQGWDVVITLKQPITQRSQWPAFREELRNLLKSLFSG